MWEATVRVAAELARAGVRAGDRACHQDRAPASRRGTEAAPAVKEQVISLKVVKLATVRTGDSTRAARLEGNRLLLPPPLM